MDHFCALFLSHTSENIESNNVFLSILRANTICYDHSELLKHLGRYYKLVYFNKLVPYTARDFMTGGK